MAIADLNDGRWDFPPCGGVSKERCYMNESEVSSVEGEEGIVCI